MVNDVISSICFELIFLSRLVYVHRIIGLGVLAITFKTWQGILYSFARSVPNRITEDVIMNKNLNKEISASRSGMCYSFSSVVQSSIIILSNLFK